jgi:hypothetical protein
MALDDQLLLHDAAALVGVALLKRGGDSEIIGLGFDREELLSRLAPALALAWPDRPEDVEDLEAFLSDAWRHVIQDPRAACSIPGGRTSCEFKRMNAT